MTTCWKRLFFCFLLLASFVGLAIPPAAKAQIVVVDHGHHHRHHHHHRHWHR
ncbi:hypothetical protein [Acidipila sp. EB88]|uniref:hypothetical protein n=1 Tax=Acidipila sp. EB88 TaxID=2305226 RepID=UPI001315A74B|nr:hypothetical protein [Acidipila sp. EB88]